MPFSASEYVTWFKKRVRISNKLGDGLNPQNQWPLSLRPKKWIRLDETSLGRGRR